MSDAEADLLYEVSGNIGYLTFNRPEARNALTFAMYDRLAEICSGITIGSGVRALVLTGAGDKAFASGTDISQFVDFGTEELVLGYEEKMAAVLEAVESCPVPTIAAIRGVCTGGGAVIAAACDLRLGAPSQRFGMPIARTLGNCLSPANNARFAAIIGGPRFAEIVFTARLVGAAESLRIGWLHEVVEEEEALMPRAVELAATIAEMAPLTLTSTKIALKRLRETGHPRDGRDLLLQCYMSDDFKEGVRAFLEKRPAEWKGR